MATDTLDKMGQKIPNIYSKLCFCSSKTKENENGISSIIIFKIDVS